MYGRPQVPRRSSANTSQISSFAINENDSSKMLILFVVPTSGDNRNVVD
jgi:hypothetical protein